MTDRILRLPALVVLVGPSGAGKSTWAEDHFLPGELVSSDRLREAVGRGPTDQEASEAAFDILARIVDHRLSRGLTAVVDTTGLNPTFRQSMRAVARKHGMRAVAVLFDTPAELCRARNRARLPRPVPATAITGQIRNYRVQRPVVQEEDWDLVMAADQVTGVTERADELARAEKASSSPGGVGFGLQVSSFPWPPDQIASRLGEVAAAAEASGFSDLWVMDHLIQIPQVGRRWDAMLEGPTTTAWLAGVTSQMGLGTLVTNTSLRHPAHLAKIIATTDVLSQGRARAGLGAGWWKDEFAAYGLDLPTAKDRLDRLEDTLRLLPLMWGPGTVDFEGKTLTVTGAECYPRPVQEHIPLHVGGQGRRTLALATRYADVVNLKGDPEAVRSAIKILAENLTETGDAMEITHLSWPLVGSDRAEASALGERFRSRESLTLDEQTGRLHRLAEEGVTGFIFAPPDMVDGAEAVARLAPLVARLA